MKSIFLSLLSMLLLASCSHNQLAHKSLHDTGMAHHNLDSDHYNWSKEDNRVLTDHKKTSETFKWFADHIKKHESAIAQESKIIAEHEKKIKVLKSESNNSVEIKSMELELMKKHKALGAKHHHFLEDHNKVMKIVNELKALRMKLESHQAH